MKKLIFCFSILMVMMKLNSQTWVQRGNDIYGENGGDNAGSAVELSTSGNTVIIGSPNNDDAGTDAGQVRVYEWNGTDWQQKGVDLNGLNAGDQFGSSVAINGNGNIIVIGAPSFDGAGTDVGMVRAYQWSGSAWIQMGADLVGGSAGIQDRFGKSIDLTDPLRLAIGAPGGGPTQKGEVKVFEWDGTNWMQMGATLQGDVLYDDYGMSVVMTNWSDYLVVGAPLNDVGGANAGAVKVYLWNGVNWIQEGSTIYGTSAYDNFGYNLAVSEFSTPVFMVNAPAIGNASYVKVYEWNTSTSNWSQRGNTLPGCGYYASTATTMSLGGAMYSRISISTASDNSIAGVTRFYLYNTITGLYDVGQSFADIIGDNAFDQSGYAIGAVNSGAGGIAVGAPGNNGNGSNSGQVKIYKYCYESYGGVITTTAHSCSYTSPSGSYTYTASGLYSDTLANAGGCDSIVQIDLTLLPPASNVTLSSCFNYTVPSGNQTYFSSGTYNDTISAIGGCDSIITINLTINNVDVTLNNNGTNLSVVTPANLYQWLECPLYTPISGETSQTFTPVSAGSYAVEITTASGCVDTSACTFMNVGLEDFVTSSIVLYPNPAENFITINGINSVADLQIIDATGRSVISVPNYFNQQTMDIEKLLPGIYLIKIIEKGSLTTKVFIKK